MARFTHLPSFYADDKDIADLFDSSRKRLTQAALLKLARRRGIFLSPDASREALVTYLSSLYYDWNGLDQLLQEIATADRMERKSSVRFATKADIEAALKVINVVKEERKKHNESHSVSKPTDERIVVNVTYTEIDTSKNRLTQQRERTLVIELEASKSTEKSDYVIRYNANQRAQQIVRQIQDRLAAESALTEDDIVIRGEGLPTPAARTEFFTTLITTLPKFTLHDVTTAKVGRPHDDHADDDDAQDDEGDADEEDEKNDPATQLVTGIVKDALLRGKSLLTSPEFKHLEKLGFGISSAVWVVDEDVGKDAKRVEFEAGFEEEAKGAAFSYRVRSVTARKKDGEFASGRKPPSEPETQRFLRTFEDRARTVFKAVSEKHKPAPPVGEESSGATEAVDASAKPEVDP